MDNEYKKKNQQDTIESVSSKVEDRVNRVERHTHNGIDSDRIQIVDLSKNLLPRNQDEYLFYGASQFNGTLRIGYPAGLAPQLSTTTITDSLGNTHIGVDPASIIDVNNFLQNTHEITQEFIIRIETLTRVLIQNGFASYVQNDASSQFNPEVTYFDRI